MAQRIEWIDVYKGILILIVVLGHSIQDQLIIDGMNVTENFWRNIIYSFHMPAFMALSGYVALYSCKNYDTFGNCLSAIKKRAMQIFIPFTIWTFTLYLTRNDEVPFWKLILFPNIGYWFLWALFFINIIFISTFLLSKKTKSSMFKLTIITIIALWVTQTIIPNGKILGYEYIAFYYPFYMIGYYSNKYQTHFPQSRIIIALIFTMWLISACFWTPNKIPFFLQDINCIPKIILQIGF